MSKDKELKKACEIIEGLIDAIDNMPLCWVEFVGDNLAKRTLLFMAKHDIVDNDLWQEYLTDFEDEL